MDGMVIFDGFILNLSGFIRGGSEGVSDPSKLL